MTPSPQPRRPRRPLRALATWAVLLGTATRLGAETHANLQSVTANGLSAWNGTFPVLLTGILLNDPGEMLDWTPRFVSWDGGAGMFQMGGEWQVVVQADAPGDRGGTTCWLGQNYGNLPFVHDSELSYSNAAWVAEVNRLNYDPETFHRFRAGDRVQVTVRGSLFYGGKRNVNEMHDIDPARNFDLTLLTAGQGLPAPEVITLAEVVRPDDGNPATREDIFDPTRLTGGEHWQGMRVRITGLSLVTQAGWNPTNLWNARKCTVTDGANRIFTLRLPRTHLGPAPTHRFDALGIFTQESGVSDDGTFGYELFVQEVIPETVPAVSIASQVVVTWPLVGGTYQLQEAHDLENGPWTPIPATPTVIEGQNTVLVEPVASGKFYRLQRLQSPP